MERTITIRIAIYEFSHKLREMGIFKEGEKFVSISFDDDSVIICSDGTTEEDKKTVPQRIHEKRILEKKIDDLDLSVRAYNAIKGFFQSTLPPQRIQISEVTVGELLKYDENDLLKTRNFGRKSLTEIGNVLTDLGKKYNFQGNLKLGILKEKKF